jgi:hypothetical protein
MPPGIGIGGQADGHGEDGDEEDGDEQAGDGERGYQNNASHAPMRPFGSRCITIVFGFHKIVKGQTIFNPYPV